MDNERKRFEETMGKINVASVCEDYKNFARDVVRGIFGVKEDSAVWKVDNRIKMEWVGGFFELTVGNTLFVQKNNCEIRDVEGGFKRLFIPFDFHKDSDVRVRLSEGSNPIFETKKYND
jgi:hypothetical protein